MLPHVVLTGDGDWNPSVVDHDLIDDEQWFDVVSDFPDALDGSPFDAEGNYRNLHVFDFCLSLIRFWIITSSRISLGCTRLMKIKSWKINRISLSCAPTLHGFLMM
jgi:hypothetical protein